MSLPKQGRIGADVPKQYRKTVQHHKTHSSRKTTYM
nr:MAG TPA: hypothetical protein [Caudoviricetes sp.]